MSQVPSVAIVGAGLGGVAAAIAVRNAGVADFTVFERSDGPGGTWRDTKYPGAACDIMSHLYSYSFRPKTDWSRTCAPRDEILEYIEDTVDELGIRPHFRFETVITNAVWNEKTLRWTVTTAARENLTFDVLVCATGLLNVPKYPDWPGLEDFTGTAVHTARWNSSHAVRGQYVAVVGTGSSAAQVVPALAPEVSRLYVFQREPGWLLPKDDRAYTEAELAKFRRNPLAARRARWKFYWRNERNVAALRVGSRANRRTAEIAKSWLTTTVDDERVRAALQPDYPFGCKRPVADRIYYSAFNRPNVELVPHAVTEVRGNVVIAADGSHRKVDTLVLATGFQATEFLSSVDVVGRGGVRLQDTWEKAGGPEAFLGIAVSGYPNLYLLYGPNTNPASNSVIFNLECQARYIGSALRTMRRRRVASLEVRKPLQDRYNSWLQRAMKGIAWSAGCTNYYHTASGKQVTNWPRSTALYWLLTRLLRAPVPGLYRRRRRQGGHR